jgi:hypothetical protein
MLNDILDYKNFQESQVEDNWICDEEDCPEEDCPWHA